MIRYDAVEKNFLTEDNADPLYLCWDSNELEFLADEGMTLVNAGKVEFEYPEDEDEFEFEFAKIGQSMVKSILDSGEIELYPERDVKIKIVDLPEDYQEKLRELSRFLE